MLVDNLLCKFQGVLDKDLCKFTPPPVNSFYQDSTYYRCKSIVMKGFLTNKNYKLAYENLHTSHASTKE